MDKNNIKKEVKSFFVDNFSIDEKKLRNDINIFDELGIDSLGIILIITFIEKRYKIEIEQKEIVFENFESVNTLANFIEEKINSESI